ncbi:DUF2789 domain-containing protein [Seongchinamella unica]|uniref:DUF2789 domain-containing protein n=1 Tax=Seongchinamella unica TaxID=2547392 RepID=A0A4R5LWT4_9GAMM|nr:DUF2789 domain-containing protein [Seongchinamella unica]TDG15946.1 DUF2789 domain-containing protein [Seongchinamella unica]
MDTSSHTLSCLFRQLGLPSSDTAMENFVKNNHLPKEIPLDHAAFWNAAQAQFIRESLDEDSDWSEVVDQLDAMLRH